MSFELLSLPLKSVFPEDSSVSFVAKRSINKRHNASQYHHVLPSILIVRALYPMKDSPKVQGSNKNRWLGWPGQKEGDSLI